MEGPFNLFSSVTTTATATTHTSTDYVFCRGAKAVHIVVYNKSKDSTATINTGTVPMVVTELGTLAVAGNAGIATGVDCQVPATGIGLQLRQGATMSALAPGGTTAGLAAGNGRIAVYAIGAVVITSTGVAQNEMVANAYVVWN
jgi:hypothetical protein